jgi:hypothetical protein
MKDGTCTECGDYKVTSADKKSCDYPKCGDDQRILEDGVCETCEYLKRPADDKLSCEQDCCTEREVLIKGGKCKRCVEYTRPRHMGPNADGQCKPDECGPR